MALVSVARAKRKRVLARTNTTELEDILEAASDWIENYCDRLFDSATFTETLNGDGTPEIWVKNTPVTSITSITITDTSGDDEELAATDYIFQPANGRITFGPDNTSSYSVFPSWPAQNIAIVYVGAYATVPDAVQEACVLVAIQMLKQSGTDRPVGVKDQQIGEASRTAWGSDEPILTGQIADLLSQYRYLEA